MGVAGDFPDIRTYLKGQCVVCALPQEVREYMDKHVAEGIDSWAAWKRWLEEVGHDVGSTDRIGYHYRKNH